MAFKGGTTVKRCEAFATSCLGWGLAKGNLAILDTGTSMTECAVWSFATYASRIAWTAEAMSSFV